MDIFRVVGIGIAAAAIAGLLKGWRPEIAIQVSLAASAVIFFMLVPYLKTVLEMFRNISGQIGIETKYITLILKVIGIAYVTQFGAELCRDAGESAVASKIELAGKVIIMTLSMPVMYKLLEVVDTIVRIGVQ